MSKTIEIVVDPRGGATVRTSGFARSACREASRFVEEALGLRTAETLTAEFHQGLQAAPRLEQSN
ncbi:DUF2997 domain-containing protein [Paludisphaera mucosa]|uniref:DUF2997 domain-containing protein n=1 Tax=Paludisphaera mucosa TaxID=3030827 RepID=A0ABT6FDJ7_9BACT|nr:DUF2997 domain-containing protein [Paludisphaera mucosa]MDG3005425.1 DUF2997 domain-containing protein [Paludisphaera mucosa]